MGVVRGTWKQGRIVLDEPAAWPDGTRVEVGPLNEEGTVGLRDEDWPTDADGIAALVARMDAIEAVETSPTRRRTSRHGGARSGICDWPWTKGALSLTTTRSGRSRSRS